MVALSDPDTKPSRESGPGDAVAGVLWMLACGLLFAVFMAVVRYLGDSVDPAVAAFLRYLIGIGLMIPVILGLRRVSLASSSVRLHILRGVIHGCGVLLWFIAIARMPLAEVTALGFLAQVYITVGAALFLGEPLRRRRLIAVLVAFLGAAVILRPGLAVIDAGAFAMLAAAPMFAASDLLAKRLTRTDTAAEIVGFLSVIVTLVLFFPAAAVWQTPPLWALALIAVTAVLATLAHLAAARAYSVADISVVQPVRFMQLVWAVLIGFFLFGEFPDVWTWIGSSMIVGSAAFIAHREARLHRQAASASAAGSGYPADTAAPLPPLDRP